MGREQVTKMAFARNSSKTWDTEEAWIESLYPEICLVKSANEERLYYDPITGISVVARLKPTSAILSQPRRSLDQLLRLFGEVLDARYLRAIIMILLAGWLLLQSSLVSGG
jgi:hypothetical protein